MKYVFIGDSLTFGYGLKKSDTWVSKYRDKTDLDIINKGVNGSTTTDMLNRFYTDVLSKKPNKVFIMGGTNDLLSNRPIDSIIGNIELMTKDLKDQSIDVILGIPPTIIKDKAYELFMPSLSYDYCEDNLPLLRIELIKLAEKYNCTYVDFYTPTSDHLHENIFFDGIHLNQQGQDLLLEEFISTTAN